MKIKCQVPKNRNTISKLSPFQSLNQSTVIISKHLSQHAKISTNPTNSSLHINKTIMKNIKAKKSKSKQKLSSNSKSSHSKRFHLNQNKKSNHIQTTSINIKHRNHIKHSSVALQLTNQFNQFQEGGMSYRQYCLVDKAFVPIKTSKQMKKLQDIMRSTANTISFQNEFQQSKLLFRNSKKLFPFKKRESQDQQNLQYLLQNSFESLKSKDQNDKKLTHQNFQKVNLKLLKDIKNIQCAFKPTFCEDACVQYSQRAFQSKREQIVQKVNKEIDIQTQPIQNLQKEKKIKKFQTQILQTQSMMMKRNQDEESLSDLLLKLQFKHLPHQDAFDLLTKNQKQHYAELLSALAAKLVSSPRKKPSQAIHQHAFKIQQVNFNPLQNIVKKYQKIQMQLYKRQCIQMGLVQNPLDFDNSQVIDTSMIGISTFLFNFTCYLQINYPNQFLFMIAKPYGLTYRQRFTKILYNKNSSEKMRRQLKVLDEGLFEQFCQNTIDEDTSQNQIIHLRAIFDAINDLLDTYRPYFKNKGAPFPWTVKMLSNICQYAFDQNSMEVIMSQIKQNITQNVSNLAGIIIQEKSIEQIKQIKQLNPFILKRKQKQDLMIRKWLSQETNQNNFIQCQATNVMVMLSKQIQEMLYLQFLQEKCSQHVF